MNDSQTMTLIWAVVLLVILLSALTARRPTIGTILRSLLSWVVIGLIGFLIVAHRHQIGAIFAQATAQLGLGSQQVSGETVRIRMSPDGHFWARASLNGVERRMLIDSGATITAISASTAAAAGIDSGGGGFPVIIQTANGAVPAQRATVDEVSVGPLRTEGLGVVIAPTFENLDVLGMNFLSRLGSWRVENNTLILVPDRADGAAEPDEGVDDSSDPL